MREKSHTLLYYKGRQTRRTCRTGLTWIINWEKERRKRKRKEKEKEKEKEKSHPIFEQLSTYGWLFIFYFDLHNP